MHTTTRRRLAAIGVVAALTTPVAATVASPSAASATSTAPYCGIRWGSLPKEAFVGDQWSGNVIRTRTGMHACYDRLVFDIAPGSGRISYQVSYVDQVASLNGNPVPVVGGARIQITIKALSTLSWGPDNFPTTNFPGWRTFRQLKYLGSAAGRPTYEPFTVYGLGVRARLPMRVFVLTNADGGRRLVVDVAHRW